jgi:two-component system response regulator AtoC
VSNTRDGADDPTRTVIEDDQDRSHRPLRLLVVRDDEMISHALPRSGHVVVGRTAESTIRVDDPGISRRHFALDIGVETTVTDLGSKNGILVRGRRLQPNETAALAAGDALRAGRVLFLLQEDLGLSAAGTPPEPPGVAADVIQEKGLDDLWQIARRAAKTPISVLITGETGVGKEVFAETIHRLSPRADRPFVRLNCAALPEALLESELFGYERGAFTGAAQRKLGLLETAHGGTVFLDELGEMALPIQAKLLQVLEEKLVRRVGALKANSIDVRFISATNKNLEAAVEAQQFRRDLLFRLNGIEMHIPPLRERTGEIERLATAFVAARYVEFGLPTPPRLLPETVAALQAHPWPGNIRELKNVIDRGLVLCRDGVITQADLGLASPREQAVKKGESGAVYVGEPGATAGLSPEADELIQTLARYAGNQSRAARALGIARSTLIARMEKYGLVRPRKTN